MSIDKYEQLTMGELNEFKAQLEKSNTPIPLGMKKELIRQKWDKQLDSELPLKFQQFAGSTGAAQSSRMSMSDGTTYDELMGWLEQPDDFKEELIELSRKMYFMVSKYGISIKYYQTVLRLDSMLIPKFDSYDGLDIETINKNREKVDAFVDGVLNKPSVRNIIKSAVRDGGYYGILREGQKKTYFLQRLPNAYCRSDIMVEGEYAVEFDFSYFTDKEDSLKENYPSWMSTLYNKYVSDTELRWQALPVEESIAIPMEIEDVDAPFLVSMFRDILELDDYYGYMRKSIEADIDKVIVQKVPLDEDTGEPIVEPALIQFFHSAIDETLEERYAVISTPFEVSELNFKVGKGNDSGFSGIDTMERKVSEGSGISPAIFNDKGSAALKYNHNATIGFMFAIVERIELWANKRLKEISTKGQNYEIKFFPTTHSNVDEYIKMYSEMLNFGGSLAPLVAVQGFNQSDYIDMLQFENSMGYKDLLRPPTTAHTGGGNDEGGRPEVDDDDLSDAGEVSRDS